MSAQPSQGAQALVNVLSQQRDAAMNAAAQAQASLIVVQSNYEAVAGEIDKMKAQLAAVTAERDALKAQQEPSHGHEPVPEAT